MDCDCERLIRPTIEVNYFNILCNNNILVDSTVTSNSSL